MTENNNIPKHWQVKKLGDECKCVTGTTPPKNDPNNYGSDIPFVKPPQILDKPINSAPEKLSNKGAALARILPINSILVTCIGNLGRTAINKIPVAFNQQINAIISSDRVDGRFLFYQAQSSDFRNQLEALSVATTVAIVNKGKFETIRIVIPPLPEQLAIVSKIEELFSDLDNGKQQLLTAQQQLKVYRRALLMEGVTGKLTDTWRIENPYLDTSEELFQKIQNHLDKSHKASSVEAAASGGRKPKDQRTNKKTSNVEVDLPVLPENWNYYRLEDISYLVTDGTHFTPKYQESGVKFLSVKNVRPFYFREEHVKYISEEEHRELIVRCNPQKDDILYTKVGATYGYAAKINMEYKFSIFVSLCLIKPIQEYFSSDFLEMLMNSELIFQQARKRVSGSGVPDLHLIEIRDFKIPLPSLEEQKQIVYELESKLTVCDKIEETISQSLKQVETLRQSILKRAFEGKLVSLNYGSDDKQFKSK